VNAAAAQPSFQRLRRFALNAVVLLLAAAALFWLHRHEPSYMERFAPILVRGTPGEAVQARGLRIEIPADLALETGRVLVTPGITGSAPPDEQPSSGLWLSVPVRIEATLDSDRFKVFLRDRDGREYAPADQSPAEPGRAFNHGGEGGRMFESNIAGESLVPGFPASGRLYFEVPSDRLEGLHARFHLGVMETPNDNLVDIDLGIDHHRALALQAAATPKLRTFIVREGVL